MKEPSMATAFEVSLSVLCFLLIQVSMFSLHVQAQEALDFLEQQGQYDVSYTIITEMSCTDLECSVVRSRLE